MMRLCLLFAVIFSIGVCHANPSDLSEIDPGVLLQINRLAGTDFLDFTADYETYSRADDNWLIEQFRYFESGSAAPANEPPYINLAGYLDTDLSWEDGGQFTMLAYVTDLDSTVVSVEIYWDGQPTGVFLSDDGTSGDFGSGDGLWGITFPVNPRSLPPGEYLLELRARDDMGNLSDLWPYLTIHP